MKITFSHIACCLMLVLFIVGERVNAQKSNKRGLGYGYHSPADMEAVSRGISWWYNWYYEPDQDIKSSYKQYDVEYVPMIWGGAFNSSSINTYLSSNDDLNYLLGFNEPNFVDQANMTPSEAAAKWPELESIAEQHGLEIIGPAVNYCGNCVTENGTTYTDPFDYLDDFFAACEGCRVDYIAVHWYGCGGLDHYLRGFEKYGKPLWVTEIACWDQENISLEQQKSYLVNVVDQMENNPNVFRYAWFAGRSEGPHISLLEEDGKLTELGELYVNMPVHDTTEYQNVPLRIEAEYYQKMEGMQLELTADDEGLMNVGYIEAGDWISYNINVASSGKYVFDLRVAGTATGKLDVKIDDQLVKTITVPNTGGWQNWQSIEDSLLLTEGHHTLKLVANTSGFNINYLDILKERISKPPALAVPESMVFSIYPNPMQGRSLAIHFGRVYDPSTTSVKVFDLLGKEALPGSIIKEEKGVKIDFEENFQRGTYLLRIGFEGNAYSKKLIVN